MSLENLLILSGIIFSIGLYGTLAKRNVIAVLMSIELMFNAVNIAAISFARYVVPRGIAVDPVPPRTRWPGLLPKALPWERRC